MNPVAFFKMTYGLYVLTAHQDGVDNGCIINTAVQVTENPNRVSIAVNQGNKTCDMIKATGLFNLSSASEAAAFDMFKHFGMQSGRSVDKFAGYAGARRESNGLMIVTEGTNMYLCCKVIQSIDLGTHMLFIAEVTDGDLLSDVNSASYAYYHSNIKPKPAAPTEKKAWVCQICGYVYEGDEVPDDYECPLCRHGKNDFIPAEEAAKAAEGTKGKLVCTICGYVHDGDTPPDECPICGVGPENFVVE